MRDDVRFNKMYREAEKDLSVLKTRDNINLMLRFVYMTISTRAVFKMRDYDQQHDMKVEVFLHLVNKITKTIKEGTHIRRPNIHYTNVNVFRLGSIARDLKMLQTSNLVFVEEFEETLVDPESIYDFDSILSREDYISECMRINALSKGSLMRGEKLDLAFKVAGRMNVNLLK